jgi:cell wall assembly regulator SMI1
LRRVASSWKIIESVLKQNAHASFKALRRPATEKSIERLKAHFNERLPNDLVASLRIHDGMRNETIFINYMTLLSTSAIIRWSKVQRSVQDLYDFEGDASKRKQAIKDDKRWRDRWIPLMADAGGNLLVMDLDPGSRGKRGQMFVWNNVGSTIDILAESLAIWLNRVADELSLRRFNVDEFGEIQLHEKMA